MLDNQLKNSRFSGSVDQDLLNVAFQGSWKELSDTYNHNHINSNTHRYGSRSAVTNIKEESAEITAVHAK